MAHAIKENSRGTVQGLHFETGWDAELGLTVLVEVFPDQIDLECSGVGGA
jgi:hypothetical protein